jgi:hydroxymethylpyrimidine/phosphomethylpyrimidine kinase
MLANGLDIGEAVREAQDYTWNTLRRAYRPGMGQYLPDRMFWARDEAAARSEGEDIERPSDVRGSH